jgi:hypothetical protein
MTIAIQGLYWDEPAPGLVILPAMPEGDCLVVWPTPIDHDACFEEAGFSEFADSTAAWDADFDRLAALLVRTVESLAGAANSSGTPAPASGLARLWHRPPAPKSPVAALIDAADDDRLGRVTILFGKPATAALTTGDGHPLWWLHSSPTLPSLRGQVRAACADALPLSRRTLPWAGLSPFRP